MIRNRLFCAVLFASLGGVARGAEILPVASTPTIPALTDPRPDERGPVGAVEVDGAKFMSRRSVLSKVKVRVGDVVVDPAFRADMDRLLETGLFDDVRVSLEDLADVDAQGRRKVKVVFHVQERPIVRRIDFKGPKQVSASRFRDELVSKVDEAYDRYKAGQDVQKILDVYHEEGYADAQVEHYTSLDPRTNKVLLTFFVTEGKRILVREVSVRGNRVFGAKKIRKVLKKTRRKKVFKEESLNEDLEALRLFYKNRGFLEVFVGEPGLAFNDEKTSVGITLTVDEGRRYTVGQFAFEGQTLYTEAELRKAVALKPGKLYEESLMEETLRNLQGLYADKGYLRASVDASTATFPASNEAGRVDLRFVVAESSAVYVDRVYIDGNVSTKEKVFRREVLLREGDVFSAGKVRRTVEKFYNLGFMDDVQVDVQQPRSPDKADLVFTVQEGRPGVLSAGAGYSSVDGLLGTLQVQHANLFGLAQRLSLTWEFGKRKQNYEISWTEPWFLDKPMSFGVDVFNTRRLLPFQGTSSAYKRDTKGFSLRLGPRLTDRLSLQHQYSYERVRIFDIDPLYQNNVDPNLNITPEDDIKSSVLNGYVWDTRDNVFDATRGWRQATSVEVAGGPMGGNVNFYKPDVTTAIYVPTFWKFVLSLSARGGWVQTFAPSKDVPFAEKYRMGGVDTVRGYEYGGVGIDGGRAYAVLNAEYKFPIVQERSKTILQGAFFADAGGSWERLRLAKFDIGSQPRQMQSSVGFGIRFKTPVFPIRLDWGFPLNLRPGQPKRPFEFTIGSMF
jgi:outer membrane protein insertion porin family